MGSVMDKEPIPLPMGLFIPVDGETGKVMDKELIPLPMVES